MDIIVKDGQPFSMFEDEGFRNFIKILDPSYSIPSRKAVKAMVVARYTITKEKAWAKVKQASAVSLMADMWTSMNMDAYLSVTGHYVSDSLDLATVLSGVQYFPLTLSAAHIAEVTANSIAEWGITKKVSGLVVDGANNIVASVNQRNIRHIYCFAHMLNLFVKKITFPNYLGRKYLHQYPQNSRTLRVKRKSKRKVVCYSSKYVHATNEAGSRG